MDLLFSITNIIPHKSNNNSRLKIKYNSDLSNLKNQQ